MKGHVVYAAKTGLEVVAITRSKRKGDYTQKWGSLRLRFFEMEEKKRSVKVLLDTVEAHKFSRVIKHVVTKKPDKPVQVLIHTYEKQDGKKKQKVTTTVSVEYWFRNGKEGYGILLKQKNGDEIKINVPISKDEALFLADLLQHLALEQSWFTSVKEEEEVEETADTPSDDEAGDDELDEVDEDIEF
jgi:hypothetical protein